MMSTQQSSVLDHEAFLTGRLINLRKPDVERDVVHGQWHQWFNDHKNTKFLEHGVYPISIEEQAAFISSELSKPSSLILTIASKADDSALGVISLKSINHIQRRAEIAIVMGFDSIHGAAIEAMALLTKHGFDRLNLNKIYAGQHESLWKWVNTLALIGYKIEGFRDNYGYRNGKPWGAIITGVSAGDFYALQASRGGDVLTGDSLELSLTRSKTNKTNVLRIFLDELNAAP